MSNCDEQDDAFIREYLVMLVKRYGYKKIKELFEEAANEIYSKPLDWRVEK